MELGKAIMYVKTTFYACKTVHTDIQEDKQTYQDASRAKQGVCNRAAVQKGSAEGGSRYR